MSLNSISFGAFLIPRPENFLTDIHKSGHDINRSGVTQTFFLKKYSDDLKYGVPFKSANIVKRYCHTFGHRKVNGERNSRIRLIFQLSSKNICILYLTLVARSKQIPLCGLVLNTCTIIIRAHERTVALLHAGDQFNCCQRLRENNELVCVILIIKTILKDDFRLYYS